MQQKETATATAEVNKSTATATAEANRSTTEDKVPEKLLLTMVTHSLDGLDLLTELHRKYEQDSVFQPIMAKPSEYRNFEVNGRLIYLKIADRKVLCIPKVVIKGHSAREIVISEAHSILAHPGANKTLDYLRDHVWWKDMVSDV